MVGVGVGVGVGSGAGVGDGVAVGVSTLSVVVTFETDPPVSVLNDVEPRLYSLVS